MQKETEGGINVLKIGDEYFSNLQSTDETLISKESCELHHMAGGINMENMKLKSKTNEALATVDDDVWLGKLRQTSRLPPPNIHSKMY